MNGLTFAAVSESNWIDLEALFECRGGPHSCWCMVWRHMADGRNRASKADKKHSLESYVKQAIPIGLLCYENAKPIAWCSIAPRDSYRKLGGNMELENVWSLVCFFVKREHRKKGLIKILIKRSEEYARVNGANYLEAYPVDKESPSYRFMGFKPTFKELGFEFHQKAGTRRYAMIKKIA